MTAKPVQISIDTELLRRVDSDPETLEKGRSAFVRAAIKRYLKAKEQVAIEEAIAEAYKGQADALRDEISDFVDAQAWPEP